jgi:hypothetical protein
MQETHPRLRFDYLPKYCPHVKPVEGVWRRLRKALAANRLDTSLRVFVETVEPCFTAMTPKQALDRAVA